jgi:hypothetical protein
MRRVILVTLCLLAIFGIGLALWLQSVRHQYALNRALIAALVKNEDREAFALVKAGARK